VAWAETAVAATIIHGTADTSVAAVGRAETIIQVVATSPPTGSQRRRRRLLQGGGSSREPIAFFSPLSATELKRLLLPTFFFWDPEGRLESIYMRSAAASNAVRCSQ
jgi:hypothetical protein